MFRVRLRFMVRFIVFKSNVPSILINEMVSIRKAPAGDSCNRVLTIEYKHLKFIVLIE